MFWILFVFLIIIFSIAGTKQIEKKRDASLFKIALVVLLSYVISAGASFATDHINYLEDYENTKYLKFADLGFDLFRRYALGQEGYEFGYELLALIGHKLHLAFPGFMFFLMLFVNFVYVDFAFKHKYPVLSLLFFCISNIFFLEANLVRQSIAVSIFIFSLRYVEKKELLKCILSLVVAMLFHISAVILIPIYLLLIFVPSKYDNKARTTLCAIWVVSVLIAVFNIDISLGYVRAIENDALSQYSNMYMNNDDNIGMKASFDFLGNLIILFSLLLPPKEFKIEMILLMIGIIFLNISVPIPNMGRIALYFTAILPLMYTTITTNLEKTKYKGLGSAFLIVLCLNFIRLLLTVQIPNERGLGSAMYSLSSFFE